jgi:hypothetical protein
MTYVLMLWTAVAMAGDRHVQQKAYDWRPMAEFHETITASANSKCEEAARQLGLKSDRYRCIRTK